MRLFKTSYRDESGKIVKAKTWSVDFVDHLQIRRRIPLKITDRRACETIGRHIETLVALKVAGMQPDRTLTEWLETIPAKLRDRLAAIGLLSGERAAGGKSLNEHLDDFRAYLIAKGDTAPVLSAKEAMKALEIVHALYASGEQGGWVNMADQPRSSLLGRGA